MRISSALLEAIKQCQSLEEEEGGIILRHPQTDEYEFFKIHNENSGQPIALVLWTADRMDYAKKVIPKFKEGWTHYASVHTHPRFLPFPSNIDTTQLFPGFQLNYIYSPMFKSVALYEFSMTPNPEDPVSWVKAYNVNPEDNYLEEVDTHEMYAQLVRE